MVTFLNQLPMKMRPLSATILSLSVLILTNRSYGDDGKFDQQKLLDKNVPKTYEYLKMNFISSTVECIFLILKLLNAQCVNATL